jgi:hypothetical protein
MGMVSIMSRGAREGSIGADVPVDRDCAKRFRYAEHSGLISDTAPLSRMCDERTNHRAEARVLWSSEFSEAVATTQRDAAELGTYLISRYLGDLVDRRGICRVPSRTNDGKCG